MQDFERGDSGEQDGEQVDGEANISTRNSWHFKINQGLVLELFGILLLFSTTIILVSYG